MDEEANTPWIRRTKFSHTICHQERFTRLNVNSGPSPSSFAQMQISASSGSKTLQKPVMGIQRSLSPLTGKMAVFDTFKEAQKDLKRFLTPLPERSKPERKDRSRTSPLRHLGSMKISDRLKSRKDSSWAMHFDQGGVRVTAVEAAEEFAHGAHSRLYHGIYKEQPVAVKILTVPDDDEDGAMATRLENEFSREVKPSVTDQQPELDQVTSSKPESILIDQDFRMKIEDFGIACEEAYCGRGCRRVQRVQDTRKAT
uniref:Uncharacterized protein n=1 Tax=Kalanchoe fedtschenkoi TaxID=63787 RepID=A0A7N0VED5_KALFE